MPNVLQENEIVYFWLPAIGETSTIKEIANLVVYSLLTAAKSRRDTSEKIQAYLFIDEVQQVASEGFKLILNQGRSHGLSMIMANQSELVPDVRLANRLLDSVRTNAQTAKKRSCWSTIRTRLSSSRRTPMVVSPQSRFGYTAHVRNTPCVGSIATLAWLRMGAKRSGFAPTFTSQRRSMNGATKLLGRSRPELNIVAHRTADGIAHVQGGNSTSAPAEEEGMERVAIAVPHDSKWRARLMDVYKRRALPSEVRQ